MASIIRRLRLLRRHPSFTTAIANTSLGELILLNHRGFQTVTERPSPQSIGFETENSKLDDRPIGHSVGRQLKSAEQLFMEAVAGLEGMTEQRSAKELFMEAVAGYECSQAFGGSETSASDLKETTELTPALHVEKASGQECAEASLVHAIEGLNFETKTEMNTNATEKGTPTTETNMSSQEQKIRMELDKAAALAKFNLEICESAVAEAQANGLPFPKFESLLVEKTWQEALKGELQKPYMGRLHQYLSQEAGRTSISPSPAKVFYAFNSCPLDKVKVVIIGQDPYTGPGQASGLSFSVQEGSRFPPTLRNIFKEIQNDLGCVLPLHGNLEKWAHQGVLLLNIVLTVGERYAISHANKGWELFTDAAIQTISQQRSGVVFLLWGKLAQEKIRLLDESAHHILKAVHPSTISAYKGFFNCRHFSKTNKILQDQGLRPIDWQV